MSDGAHLLIPFAASEAGGCREALAGLRLPHLQSLLSRLAPAEADDGDGRSLSMPHERLLARAQGIAGPDGLLPWAAWHRAQRGEDVGNRAWAWITPCHWRVGTGHVTMDHPEALQLDERASRELLAAMRPYFEQDGITLDYEMPTQWLASGDVFRGLPTASLDRVVGRTVDDWMPRSEAGRPIRRLQQEMQMLLYTHPVNEARAGAGLLPVNSFWVSGTGALPAGASIQAPEGLVVPQDLRTAALQGDWPAWRAAWERLDGEACARLVALLDERKPVALSLCGERSARTWRSAPASLWRRLAGGFRRASPADILETL